ncbi:hypothetical protein GE09DRAFT_660256 [Coniochaeta sp. 2T2.1]|nr:hypothetical protein GE09DRAFT_660256 [Coniochaeta sp. 2T2.1]
MIGQGQAAETLPPNCYNTFDAGLHNGSTELDGQQHGCSQPPDMSYIAANLTTWNPYLAEMQGQEMAASICYGCDPIPSTSFDNPPSAAIGPDEFGWALNLQNYQQQQPNGNPEYGDNTNQYDSPYGDPQHPRPQYDGYQQANLQYDDGHQHDGREYDGHQYVGPQHHGPQQDGPRQDGPRQDGPQQAGPHFPQNDHQGENPHGQEHPPLPDGVDSIPYGHPPLLLQQPFHSQHGVHSAPECSGRGDGHHVLPPTSPKKTSVPGRATRRELERLDAQLRAQTAAELKKLKSTGAAAGTKRDNPEEADSSPAADHTNNEEEPRRQPPVAALFRQRSRSHAYRPSSRGHRWLGSPDSSYTAFPE